jgi:uncharacterized protein DUF551
MRWINTKEQLPEENQKVLAVYVSKKDQIYNLLARGWFRDTIYSCRFEKNQFVIESHGPALPVTHWMPLPEPPLPEDE